MEGEEGREEGVYIPFLRGTSRRAVSGETAGSFNKQEWAKKIQYGKCVSTCQKIILFGQNHFGKSQKKKSACSSCRRKAANMMSLTTQKHLTTAKTFQVTEKECSFHLVVKIMRKKHLWFLKRRTWCHWQIQNDKRCCILIDQKKGV